MQNNAKVVWTGLEFWCRHVMIHKGGDLPVAPNQPHLLNWVNSSVAGPPRCNLKQVTVNDTLGDH